jgi:hypothetical protein
MKEMQNQFCLWAVVGVWVYTGAALLVALNIHMREREEKKNDHQR